MTRRYVVAIIVFCEYKRVGCTNKLYLVMVFSKVISCKQR